MRCAKHEKNECKFCFLEGKTVTKISSERDDVLIIHTTDSDIEFHCQGDCCSHSWIEHFSSPTEPEVIVEFKQVEVPPTFVESKTKTDNYEEEVQYYFYELVTEKNTYQIEMRNSSNGYYGGWLE